MLFKKCHAIGKENSNSQVQNLNWPPWRRRIRNRWHRGKKSGQVGIKVKNNIAWQAAEKMKIKMAMD